jgi:hypothetical protein
MTVAHKLVCSMLLLTLLVMQGCDKKKKATVPRQGQAPTVAVTLPTEIPLTQEPEEGPAPVVTTPPPAQPANAKTKPKKPARNSTSTAKKTTPPATAAASTQGNQTEASVRPPGNPADAVPETMIAAAVPNAQLVHQKEETSHMVDATENELKGLTRSLSDEEKGMKSQVESYLRQSRKATTDGDFERAFNLAKKAQLLADALVKK